MERSGHLDAYPEFPRVLRLITLADSQSAADGANLTAAQTFLSTPSRCEFDFEGNERLQSKK